MLVGIGFWQALIKGLKFAEKDKDKEKDKGGAR